MLDLDYTGHPLFDVGLATIVAYVEKEDPAELDEEDLRKAATFIEEYYTQQPLTSFLTTSLMNSYFTNPAYTKKPEIRLRYAQLIGEGFGPNAPKGEEICVFTGKPTLGLSLKFDKEEGKELPPGRAFRQHIPLLTGEEVINFSPWGDRGLPISGEALVCLQFFPMGCRKCAGRLLAIHSDNRDILFDAAYDALRENRSAISLALEKGETKLPDASASAPSLLMETIVLLTQKRERALKEKQPYSITAYHLTNSGQSSPLDEKSPPLKIYSLPMNLIRFFQIANHPDHKRTWNRLVARGQERTQPTKDTQANTSDAASVARRKRNFFYEELLQLPEKARGFIRGQFLPDPEIFLSQLLSHDQEEKMQQGNFLVPWPFIAIFLQEVIHMEKERIDAIKKLGEELATYIKTYDDRRFLTKFYAENRSVFFRSELLRADKQQVLNGQPPLFRFDAFCRVFFTRDGDELRFDWQLARDLVCIRMLECLYDLGYRLKREGILSEERDVDNIALNNEEDL
jgi:CRISPR-associated protein Cst1